MSISHALVVDDSRSARLALKKLLEEQNLDVSLADSGEEALEFLKKNDSYQVDVIFMDHTMPGMDGLEAVSAIKANPKTAAIPVMMYTTKEGELYVGQARALGAVGVMSKNVQPHQLFEMLSKLGLVKERRARTQSLDAESAESADAAADGPVGISVQNVVSRILEDQHLTLRSDILRSQRTFAKEVAKEIVLEQARAEDLAAMEEEERVATGIKWASVAAVIGVVVLGLLVWQFKAERDQLATQLAQLEQSRNQQAEASEIDFESALAMSADETSTLRRSALAALAWAVNSGHETGLEELAFNQTLAQTVQDLISYLRELEFKGSIRLTSHLGRFCLLIDDLGNYVAPTENISILDCDYIGHPLEESPRVSDRLSVPFSRVYNDFDDDGDITIELVALTGAESTVAVVYPDTTASAFEWNAVAELNNRVEIDIQAHSGAVDSTN